MSVLKIPYASTSPFSFTSLVHADLADRAIPYYCPSCHVRLILRNGDIRIKHFSHPVSSCSLESIYHLTAKSLIFDIFKSGHFYDIRFSSLCSSCLSPSSFLFSFPDSVTDLALEYSLHGYVYDILCFSGSVPIFAIEICYSHSVDSVKSLSSPIPIFEFRALDILSTPYSYPAPILHGFSWSDFPVPIDSCDSCYWKAREAQRIQGILDARAAWNAREAREILEARYDAEIRASRDVAWKLRVLNKLDGFREFQKAREALLASVARNASDQASRQIAHRAARGVKREGRR